MGINPLLEIGTKFHELGSVDNSRQSYYTAILFGFESGKNLSSLKEDFEEFKEAFPFLPKFMFAIYQAILNLSGENVDNNAILSENFVSQPGCMTGFHCLCRYLSYIFQDYT